MDDILFIPNNASFFEIKISVTHFISFPNTNRKSTFFNGSLWFDVACCSSLWLTVVHRDSLWLIVACCGSLCFIVSPCGSLCLIVAHFVLLWLVPGSLVLCGCICLIVAHFNLFLLIVAHYVAPCGSFCFKKFQCGTLRLVVAQCSLL